MSLVFVISYSKQLQRIVGVSVTEGVIVGVTETLGVIDTDGVTVGVVVGVTVGFCN